MEDCVAFAPVISLISNHVNRDLFLGNATSSHKKCYIVVKLLISQGYHTGLLNCLSKYVKKIIGALLWKQFVKS